MQTTSNSGKHDNDTNDDRNACITCQPLHSMVSHTLGTSAQLITNVIEFLKWFILGFDIAPSAVSQVTILLFALLYVHHHTGRHRSCNVAGTDAVEAFVLVYSIIDYQDACVRFNKLNLFKQTYIQLKNLIRNIRKS
jgi:hypothetical protein